MERVVVYLPEPAQKALERLALAQRRSVSSMAAMLLERELADDGSPFPMPPLEEIEKPLIGSNGATMGLAGGDGAPSPAPAAGHEVRPDPKPGAKR